ncbi:MAG: type II secretion system protein GspN, partial [Treponemataceae bacterium]|nr:type II secretion system protein GspN [Treponemataceae bacterium]
MRFRIPFNRTVAWYTLCFLVILVVMLYLRFPGAVIADYLIASIRAKHPDVLVNIDAVEPAFPPGVKITNIGVSFRENPQANFQTDFVTVKPDYMALFERTLKLVIEGGAYGGTINGNLLVTEETFTKGSLQGELRWQGLNLEKVGYLRERLNRQVTGRMRATVTFNGNINNPAATNGRIIFLVTGGVYPLLSPV